MTTIVCQQLAPQVADLQANRAMSLSAISDAVAAGADVVVLPELITSGYMFESAEEAASVAVAPEDPLFEEWAAAAGSAVGIGGFAERGGDGLAYHSAAAVDPSGVIGVYRRVHLWDREKRWFAPGGEAPRVFDTPAGRIGVLVCYDVEFPEMPRTLALAGAELICVPTNWPYTERPDGERPGEVVIAQAAARVNRVAVACCDRTGTERAQAWNGGTSIIDQDGWVLDAQPGVGPASATVDLARSHDKAFTDLADAMGDRRPALYGAVSQPVARPVA